MQGIAIAGQAAPAVVFEHRRHEVELDVLPRSDVADHVGVFLRQFRQDHHLLGGEPAQIAALVLGRIERILGGQLAEVAALASQGDTLICLFSGGASAHLTLPAEGLTLNDLRKITEALLHSGAPIQALNTVRKHCERLKGGKLAQLAMPAQIW